MVIYHDLSSLEKAEKIQNYYGFKQGISGKDLYLEGINQAKNLKVEVKDEEVTKIENTNNEYKVITNKQEYQSKTIILATGNKKNKPKIKGIEEFEGKGVSYCAVCDAFFYRNKDVAVLGNGNYAISEVNELINLANKITILTNGKKENSSLQVRSQNVEVDTKEIQEIQGKERLEKVEFKDGTNLKIDGIFIAQGVAGGADFAKKLGIFTKQDKIIVNENMQTNLKGVFACGDCTGGLLQISKAVYEGTVAGLSTVKYIREDNQ